MIQPFEYCTKCGLVYCHIQNFDCVVCHGDLAPIEGLLIPERKLTPRALDSAPPYTAEELDIITDTRRNGALRNPPSQ